MRVNPRHTCVTPWVSELWQAERPSARQRDDATVDVVVLLPLLRPFVLNCDF